MSADNKYQRQDSPEAIPQKKHGIDLGTVNCCVAQYQDGKAETLTHGYDNRTFPSTITVCNGIWQIGRYKITDVRPTGVFIHGTKYVIGRDESDGKLRSDIQRLDLPFELDNDGKPYCEVDGQVVRPEEIYALFLLKAQEIAREAAGKNIQSYSFTVPAYFTGTQREASVDAARIAGVQVARLINEPTSIALAHLHSKDASSDGIYVVIDVGGGTTDAAEILLETRGNAKTFAVQRTAGNNTLGGYDFTEVMFREFKKRIGHDVDERELRSQCEAAKNNLDRRDAAIPVRVGSKEHSLELEVYQAACRKLRDSVKSIMRRVCPVGPQRAIFKGLIPAGGSSKLPFFMDDVREIFGDVPVCAQLPPAEAVAQGAAIAMDEINTITDTLSRSVGIETQSRQKTRQGKMSVVLERDTSLPASAVREFVAVDKKETEIRLFEGEDNTTASNIRLGEFVIEAPAGQSIDVHVIAQDNSLITVRATTKDGSTEHIVTRSTQFTDAQFAEMKEAAALRFASQTAVNATKKHITPPAEDDHGKAKRKRTTVTEELE
ncbi:70-kilodalton heat shock protein [Pestalotiopsis sp. 9143b]|nr:70-kilodalton heat shock protein [Pestalotiopsis sp. 9143b]